MQLIRSYVATVDAEQLRSEIGLHGPRLAELVPEIRLLLPELGDPPNTTDPEQARFELFDAVSSFFSRAANSKPLLLILDDLQWADPASLKLLEFAAVGVPDAALMILGTYRDVELSRRHSLAETLGSIGTSSAFRRIPVRGLNRPGSPNWLLPWPERIFRSRSSMKSTTAHPAIRFLSQRWRNTWSAPQGSPNQILAPVPRQSLRSEYRMAYMKQSAGG